MVINMLLYALSGVFVEAFCLYSWYKLEELPFKMNNYKNYILILSMTLFGTLVNFFVPQYLRIILIFLMLFLVNYFFVFKRVDKGAVGVIFSQFVVMISEMILVLFISLIYKENISELMSMTYSTMLLNILIAFLSYLMLQIPIITKLYKYLLNVLNSVKRNSIIIYFLLILFLASLFMIMTYMKLPWYVLLICNTVLTILFVVVIVKMANTNANYNIINTKYETSLTSLREYESIMDRYRVDCHENKNQLLTIRNMAKANDKNLKKYIDSLVDNGINDNETIFFKTSKIPEGGLRATVYSKICKMHDTSIDYVLDIANNVKTTNLLNLNNKTLLNISKVIGVFLDNAIEAVEPLNEKNIILEMFVMDGYMCIDVSNNYEGMIELDKMANKGYTTKGKGHGYGLSLVDEIISSDLNLENEKKISRDIFTQELKIKM